MIKTSSYLVGGALALVLVTSLERQAEGTGDTRALALNAVNEAARPEMTTAPGDKVATPPSATIVTGDPARSYTPDRPALPTA